MKTLIYLLSLMLMASCAQKLKYPKTKKQDIRDDYFGTVVEDPYRWLENDTAADTEDWVAEQNKVTFAYLNKLPNRDKICRQLTDLMDYERMGTPFKRGGRYFYFKNDGLQNQSVLYMTDDLSGKASVLLDPNNLSDDGTIALSVATISDDAKYLVYSIARSGSDWNEVFVKDIGTGEMLNDHLRWVKFSNLSWYDGGVYYSRYDEPEAGSELSKSNEFQKVYYHKIGTSQSDDILVKEDKVHPKRMWGAGLTEDKRFLLLSSSEGTSGNALAVKDLSDAKGDFIQIMESYEFDFNVVNNIGDYLFVLTNYKSPKYRLVKVDSNRPQEENWEVILPEKQDVLQSVSLKGGKLVAQYMKDAHDVVEVYDVNGSFEYELHLPGIGSVGGFTGKIDEAQSFFSYSSFDAPGEVYEYNFETKEQKLFFRPQVPFSPDDFIVKQDFCFSKDGTKVPMFIIHKKSLQLDGNNPTLLYGYGGFNISLTPSYSSTRMAFIENGGVLAIANLRGGGEYGEEWHKAGTKLQKQNVFDDCIAAAEYLINSNYTNAEKLALMGGSNGGLLVGAVINQRPELFKVALPAVGVLDMLRYQYFTIGWAWAGDYGRSDDSEEMFKYLYGYSPYHQIVENGHYPAVLITTADHDDRVVPAHSFKYAARLQELNAGELPVLIRIDTKAGHGAGKPTAKIIEEYTDVWAFVFYHLGIRKLA